MPCKKLSTALLVVVGCTSLLVGALASADPPARVARLGFVSRAVSISSAEDSEWAVATLNRPLTSGDRLWVDRDSRAALEVGGATVDIDVGTGISVLKLDANGSWHVDAAYGNVWTPNRVASDWAPYRDGHWAWVDPWGWT